MDSKNRDLEMLLADTVGADHLWKEEPMSRHTTFRVGGPAEYFVNPSEPEQIRRIIRLAREREIPCAVIGNGSNLLVSDRGLRGIVIHLGRDFGEIRVDGNEISAGAGALLSAAAAAAAEAELAGMEFAAGIPGTLGGAVLMNAGAYGGEMKQILLDAEVMNLNGEIRTVPVQEMDLSYRHSIFMERGEIILSARMGLTQGSGETIRARIDELRRQRQEKQPLEYPSAGSTFKRPEGYFAGKLIMDAGLRGLSVGGAQVSEKHCGFIVNKGGATADDVLSLIERVSEEVQRQFGVALETEVRMAGFEEMQGGRDCGLSL